jgi:hypothetical protein
MAAALLAACGTDATIDLENPGGLTRGGGAASGGGAGAACVVAGDVCEQVVASLDTTAEANIKNICEGGGGTFSSGSCPTSGTVSGKCSFTGSAFGWSAPGGSFTKYYYASHPWTDATAQSACAGEGGTWSP